MTYNPMYWYAMKVLLTKPLVKRYGKTSARTLFRKAKPVYRQLLSEMEGVSDKNPMASNIYMSFVVVALWLVSARSVSRDTMAVILEEAVDRKPVRAFCGLVNMNTASGVKMFGKMMRANADWADKHPEDTNTWDFNFDDTKHEEGFYYHFTHCPIAAFCEEHGYEEITPALCNIDYTTMSMMHSVLKRDHTVAAGDGICDYWCYGDKIKDPK